MPGRKDLSKMNCSLAGALHVVGDWWTMLIVRDAMLGLSRFSEFQQSLGLARNILANRLQRLVEHGILLRTGSVRRPVYKLTEKGLGLGPGLIGLMQWSDMWLVDGQPPMVATDAAGHPLEPVALRTAAGPVAPGDLRFQPGPGADPRTRALLARMSRH